MERKLRAYKTYFIDFVNSLKREEAEKIYYALDLLKIQNKISKKFVKYLREEIYELRAEYAGNIVVLFHGIKKKTQKTPEKEIKKAIQLKKEYYAGKQSH